MLYIGQIVKYTDEVSKEHNALVTAIHGDADSPYTSINVVYVSMDENRTDSYGRQIERETSVVPKTNQSAHGRYFVIP